MSKSILEVRGIGPSTVTVLAENGIVTAADLAALEVSQLAAIKGFSEIRAGQIIADAKALLAGAAEPKAEKKEKPAKNEKVKKESTKKKDKKKDKKKIKVKKEEKKTDKKGKKSTKNKQRKKPAKKAKK